MFHKMSYFGWLLKRSSEGIIRAPLVFRAEYLEMKQCLKQNVVVSRVSELKWGDNKRWKLWGKFLQQLQ